MARKTKLRRAKPVSNPDAGARISDSAPRAKGTVKSAGRVLQIFEFFDEIQREARVAEIAERLAFPQSSASILLKCLVDLGYLEYLPEARSFLPSPRITLIGAWLDKGPIRDGSLVRMVEEISQRTGDTVIIAARHGIYSQYIYVMQARSAMRFHVPQGHGGLLFGLQQASRCCSNQPRAWFARFARELTLKRPKDKLVSVSINPGIEFSR